jgi:hypothetical protein
MTWSPNNLACTTTWSTLFALEQSVVPFPDAAEVQMQTLTFWNTAATDDLRSVEAHALALRVDAIFRLVRGAVYETDSDHEHAVTEMRDTFLTADATMETLADANDRNYRFWQEGV